MVPPAVRSVPNHIAIKITDDDSCWLTELFTVDLQILPELPNIAKGTSGAGFGPNSQYRNLLVNDKG